MHNGEEALLSGEEEEGSVLCVCGGGGVFSQWEMKLR